MEKVQFNEIEIDRCSQCEGIWFDAHEMQNLREIDGAEVVDTGASAVGEHHNDMRDVRCPICNQLMIRKADAGQGHIHYEMCPKCKGTFFDAGEFRDLKDESFFDIFKNLWPKKKK
jgi:Zn-finger nucleic acid-binding protein